MKLFQPYQLGSIELSNHIVMAPMTRSRADAQTNAPTAAVATYYAQRASAGLLITEGTSPSPNGLGYPRIPGLFSPDQIEGWKNVTEAVHEKGGKIFVQLMHTGRVSHPDNLPAGARVLAPSAIQLSGEMYTDANGMQSYPTPAEMDANDIEVSIQEHVEAAKNAIEAGFDGIELHAANGYLPNQFFSPKTNQRTDAYGGNSANRARYILEIAEQTIAAIGKERVGIRLSPYGVFNDLGPYPGMEEDYESLAAALNQLQIGYIHLVDHSAMGAPEVPATVVDKIRKAYRGTLILSGGYDKARAELDLQNGQADLIAIGRPFIANPDLVERFKADAELAQPDQSTFYTPGTKGFTDYPALQNVIE